MHGVKRRSSSFNTGRVDHLYVDPHEGETRFFVHDRRRRKRDDAICSAQPLRCGHCRDWGHARDYVEGMWLMPQQSKPDDFVLATGEAHSVREFATAPSPMSAHHRLGE